MKIKPITIYKLLVNDFFIEHEKLRIKNIKNYRKNKNTSVLYLNLYRVIKMMLNIF